MKDYHEIAEFALEEGNRKRKENISRRNKAIKYGTVTLVLAIALLGYGITNLDLLGKRQIMTRKSAAESAPAIAETDGGGISHAVTENETYYVVSSAETIDDSSGTAAEGADESRTSLYDANVKNDEASSVSTEENRAQYESRDEETNEGNIQVPNETAMAGEDENTLSQNSKTMEAPETEQPYFITEGGEESDGKIGDGNNGEENTSSSYSGGRLVVEGESGPAASFITPNNGEFYMTPNVSRMTEQYGDDAGYYVRIMLFKDGEQIKDADLLSEEAQRLSDLGYAAQASAAADGQIILKAVLSKEQIDSFSGSNEYGYWMMMIRESA